MNEASVGHQCPECVTEGRKTQRQARTAFGGSTTGAHGYVTTTLITCNVVVFLLSILTSKDLGRAFANGDTPLAGDLAVWGQGSLHGVLVPAGVATGEYYRLFTAMFMHFGIIHLASNMILLWWIGRPLEKELGPGRFLAVYIVCGLGGNVAAYLFSPGSLSAGASTAIYGLLAVYFFVLRRLNRDISVIMPLILINLFITFRNASEISVAGHLGGLATGIVIGLALAYAPRERRTLVQFATMGGVAVLLVILTLVQTASING
jgi:membrane associated rhomboid family serine protease